MEEVNNNREYPTKQMEGLIEPLYQKIEELESKYNKLVEVLKNNVHLKEIINL